MGIKKNNFVYSDSCNKLFEYWRFRTLYSIIIGFAAFYFIRMNFSLAVPLICKEFNYTKSDIGMITSIGAILYGIGKFFFGIIGDKYSARYIMVFGLFLSAIMNIFLGFSSSIPAFVIFVTLNSCFQSMGAPPCAKLLTHWFTRQERGGKWALWSSSQQIGSALILAIGPCIILKCGWRFVFFIPGIIAIFLAFFLFNRLRDTPESLKLPSVEEITGFSHVEKTAKWKNNDSKKLTYFNTLKIALSNKLVWYISLTNFFIYVCRMIFQTWGPMLLLEAKGCSIITAGGQIALLDIAGIFGGMSAGFLSDKIFKGKRGAVGAIYLIILSIVLYCFTFTKNNSQIFNSICMFCIGFFVSGPQVLAGLAATDCSHKKVAATANGLTGTFGHMGTAFAAYGGGYVAEHYGWTNVFAATIISAIIGAILFLLTTKKQSENSKNSSEACFNLTIKFQQLSERFDKAWVKIQCENKNAGINDDIINKL